jgi:hypothetical protein
MLELLQQRRCALLKLPYLLSIEAYGWYSRHNFIDLHSIQQRRFASSIQALCESISTTHNV